MSRTRLMVVGGVALALAAFVCAHFYSRQQFSARLLDSVEEEEAELARLGDTSPTRGQREKMPIQAFFKAHGRDELPLYRDVFRRHMVAKTRADHLLARTALAALDLYRDPSEVPVLKSAISNDGVALPLRAHALHILLQLDPGEGASDTVHSLLNSGDSQARIAFVGAIMSAGAKSAVPVLRAAKIEQRDNVVRRQMQEAVDALVAPSGCLVVMDTARGSSHTCVFRCTGLRPLVSQDHTDHCPASPTPEQ